MTKAFAEKKIKLMEASISRKGMQHIVDTAASIFDNPVMICDRGLKHLYHSSAGIEDDPFLDYFSSTTYSDFEMLKQIDETGDIAKVLSQDEPVLSSFSFGLHRFLGARVRDGKNVLGHAFIYTGKHPIEEDDRLLLPLLCKLIALELTFRGLSGTLAVPYHSLFADLLDNKISDPKELTDQARHLGLHFPECMRLAVLTCETNKPRISVYYIREMLLRQFPDIAAIIYKDDLVMMLPEKEIKSVLERILDIMTRTPRYKMGVSHRFDDLIRLSVYFEQAETAIESGEKVNPGTAIYHYDILAPYCLLLLAAKKGIDIRKNIQPILFDMEKYDKTNGTEHLKDLECFFAAGRNINIAADLIHVHKNTMYYRLSKIEEIFDLDLKDTDVCFALELSFKILKLV